MNESSYEEKLERAMIEMYHKKISRKQSSPLLYRLLTALGFKIRPPHYATPRAVLIFCSCYIAVLFGSLLWFVQRGSDGISWISLLATSAVVGLFFGYIMMRINIHNKKKFDLTSWDEF